MLLIFFRIPVFNLGRKGEVDMAILRVHGTAPIHANSCSNRFRIRRQVLRFPRFVDLPPDFLGSGPGSDSGIDLGNSFRPAAASSPAFLLIRRLTFAKSRLLHSDTPE